MEISCGPARELKLNPVRRSAPAERPGVSDGGEYLAGSFLSAARPAASAKIRLH